MEETRRAVPVTLWQPRLFLPAVETTRLRHVLDGGARLTNQNWIVWPETFRGPAGATLYWTSYGDASWEKLLRDSPNQLRGRLFLRLGLHCYALKVSDDRLLIWRQIRVDPPGNIVRMTLFDTTSFAAIHRRSKWRPGDPLVYEAGVLAEVDLPPDREGIRALALPAAMSTIPNQLVLVHAIEAWNPQLPRRAWKARRRTVIYDVRPSRSEVEALALNWAKSVEGHFHWIARVARDAATGKIVGDGAGVRLFLLDEHANFLGWVRKAKPGS